MTQRDKHRYESMAYSMNTCCYNYDCNFLSIQYTSIAIKYFYYDAHCHVSKKKHSFYSFYCNKSFFHWTYIPIHCTHIYYVYSWSRKYFLEDCLDMERDVDHRSFGDYNKHNISPIKQDTTLSRAISTQKI